MPCPSISLQGYQFTPPSDWGKKRKVGIAIEAITTAFFASGTIASILLGAPTSVPYLTGGLTLFFLVTTALTSCQRTSKERSSSTSEESILWTSPTSTESPLLNASMMQLFASESIPLHNNPCIDQLLEQVSHYRILEDNENICRFELRFNKECPCVAMISFPRTFKITYDKQENCWLLPTSPQCAKIQVYLNYEGKIARHGEATLVQVVRLAWGSKEITWNQQQGSCEGLELDLEGFEEPYFLPSHDHFIPYKTQE